MLFIVIALLVFITQSIFTHWWLIIVDSFAAALFFGRSAWGAFFSGLLAVGLVWLGQSYYLDLQNEHLLITKISQLFKLTPELLFAVTAGVGGLVGGFSALSGYSLRALWKK